MKKIVKFGSFFLLTLTLLLPLASCGDNPIEEVSNPVENQETGEPNELTVISLTESQELVSQKVPEFSERIFKALNQEYSDQNVIFSPLSCQWCLSMLANACQGKAHDQIMEVLGYQDFSLEQINDYNLLLTTEIKKRDNTVTVESANGMFQAPRIAPYVTQSYKELLSESYNAEIITSKNLIKSINEWVKAKTHGMIPSLYDEKSSDLDDAVIGLVNALYFKGSWKVPFDKKKSYKDKFYLSDGRTQNVEYMFEENMINSVYSYPLAKSVELPFGNGAFYMEIILPNEGVGINELVENLEFSQKQYYFSYSAIEFSLPKFTTNTLFQLNQVLQGLGMKDIFGMGAIDFSPMLQNVDTSKMYLGDIRQGCGFNIDEKGATAAAATSGVILDGCSWKKPEEMVFNVNRPFLFVIKDWNTNSILLMGKVLNPVE